MHLFQNKMNKSIVHRLLLFPSGNFLLSFKQFSNSISKMTRLWRRSNFGANFQFLRKKWTGDLLHLSEQPVIRRSNVWRIRRMRRKTFHLSVSKYFFYDFSDMRPSVVMKKNNFIMSLLVFQPFFSQCTAQTNNCSRYRSPVMESSGFSSS